MNFDTAFDILLGHEGGYSDNPNDPGGPTNWGVTEKVARFDGYMGDMKDFPQEWAKKIYRTQYWDKCGIDRLPADVQFDVFDGAVNSGNAQSVKWLQRALGVDDDGVVGPVTLAACENIPGGVIAKHYNGHRLAFMTSLKTWPVFGGGWARRIANNLMRS